MRPSTGIHDRPSVVCMADHSSAYSVRSTEITDYVSCTVLGCCVGPCNTLSVNLLKPLIFVSWRPMHLVHSGIAPPIAMLDQFRPSVRPTVCLSGTSGALQKRREIDL